MADEKDPHDKYKKKVDEDLKAADKFLAEVKISGMRALVEAHDKVKGDIESDIEGYVTYLHSKLGDAIKDSLGITKETDHTEQAVDSIMQRHYGLSKQSIENLVKTRGDKSLYFLDRGINEGWQRFRREHLSVVAQKHVNKDNLENAVKYLNLDRIESYDPDSPMDTSALQQAMYIHAIEGITDENLPEQFRKEYKSKKEKEEEK